MHSIVTTEGFIIDSRPYGDAGKLLYIFTRDFGLIVATAQGIRLEKSKLRYFIQDYSFGIYSFVKGKEYWRLTNAGEINQIVDRGNSGLPLILKAKIAVLLKKMLQGEEAHPELFDVIFTAETSLQKHLFGNLASIEQLIVLRIMYHLGYIGKIGELGHILETNDITGDILMIVEENSVFINKEINKAIKESHL